MLFPLGCDGVRTVCTSGVSHFALEGREERNPSGQVSCSGLCGAPRMTSGIRVLAESVMGEAVLGREVGVGDSWTGNPEALARER